MRNCCHMCWIHWWRGDLLCFLISGQCLCLPQKLFANRKEFLCSLREMLSLNSRRLFGHYMKGKLLACCVLMPKSSCPTSNWIRLFLWIHILDIMQINKILDIKLVTFYKKFLKFGNAILRWLEYRCWVTNPPLPPPLSRRENRRSELFYLSESSLDKGRWPVGRRNLCKYS
jgi:hypothetical protein